MAVCFLGGECKRGPTLCIGMYSRCFGEEDDGRRRGISAGWRMVGELVNNRSGVAVVGD